jgi:cytochrome c553
MKRRLLRVSLLAMAALAAGLLIAALGWVSIGASSGHFAVTSWFLKFAMQRSVATHAPPQQGPSVDPSWLVEKGATHYETGCRPCHGSPGLPQPKVMQGMLPVPSPLDLELGWTPEELFWLIKHGVKFTGMPAFPSQRRDDEVRALVAFVRLLPGLSAEDYQRLAFGETAAPLTLIGGCDRCHARTSAAFPRLAGQKKEALLAALEAYASGARHSGIMEPIAIDLDARQREEVATHYTNLPPEAPQVAEPGAIERGRQLALHGVPERRVPACAGCHGPKPHITRGEYPLLNRQPSEFLMLQLELFKSGDRGGSPYSRLMDQAAHTLTEEQMRDVAAFYASAD